MTLLEPKEITLKTTRGNDKTFILSKLPAIAGREIMAKYPVANMPKLGEYEQSEETMLKLMAFVGVITPTGDTINLTSRALVDNHVEDWETLAKLEWSQLEYNASFFGNGKSLSFLQGISQNLQGWITTTLMPSLLASLKEGKPPSKS